MGAGLVVIDGATLKSPSYGPATNPKPAMGGKRD